MKKIMLVFTLPIVLVGAFVFFNKLYYPPLPIESVSKKEVVGKLKSEKEPLIPLASENGIDWYIVNEGDQSVANELIIEKMSHEEWEFKDKEGSGLFFEKANEKLIITTEKWTSDYTLVKIPSE